ncbi:hypothetical protein HAX54_003274, partial [Datura stramonium]|nr:hypothetical protein [Datura stramonium]
SSSWLLETHKAVTISDKVILAIVDAYKAVMIFFKDLRSLRGMELNQVGWLNGPFM